MSIRIALAALAAGIAVGYGGYWFGARGHAATAEASAAAATASAGAGKARKLLYYRNPMGLPDTSPTPKKDQMGMDYIPVYEGEDDSSAPGSSNLQLRISTEKIQKLGVRTEAAAMRPLGKLLRVAGRVEPDERRVYVISPKFEGYVERLHVNVTGQPVGKGQPLFEVYSPEMVSAQREYAIAVQGVQQTAAAGPDVQASMKQLADSSLARLRNWDLSSEQIASLVKTANPQRTVTFRSPASGIVTEKKAVQGMRFMPGEMLYQVTDLSSVWVIADVFEQDVGLLRTGTRANLRINSYPDRTFEGRVTYIYPTLNAETRTVPVRLELPNPGHLLKPAMFAQVDVKVGSNSPVLTVPDTAIIDSGKRQIVLVQVKDGRFEPREVRTGVRSDNYVEVLEGVRDGEQVVVAANFLIDAESNLKSAVSGMSGATAAAPATSVGHKAEGTVEALDPKENTVTMKHGPVPSLKWPGMSMEFKLANPSMLQNLKAGSPVSFEFVERKPGEWVITSIMPAAATAAATPPLRKPAAGGHSGH